MSNTLSTEKSPDEPRREQDSSAPLCSAWTPGPWGIDPFVAQVNEIKTGEPICKLLWPTDKRSEEETRRNAELIAEAPQLAKDLERYQAQVGIWRMNLEDLVKWSEKMSHEEIVDYVRGMLTPVPLEPNAEVSDR